MGEPHPLSVRYNSWPCVQRKGPRAHSSIAWSSLLPCEFTLNARVLLTSSSVAEEEWRRPFITSITRCTAAVQCSIGYKNIPLNIGYAKVGKAVAHKLKLSAASFSARKYYSCSAQRIGLSTNHTMHTRPKRQLPSRDKVKFQKP